MAGSVSRLVGDEFAVTLRYLDNELLRWFYIMTKDHPEIPKLEDHLQWPEKKK